VASDETLALWLTILIITPLTATVISAPTGPIQNALHRTAVTLPISRYVAPFARIDFIRSITARDWIKNFPISVFKADHESGMTRQGYVRAAMERACHDYGLFRELVLPDGGNQCRPAQT
jgi:hypothetical protein